MGGHRPGNRRSIDILRQPKSFGARPSSSLVKLLALYHVSAQVSRQNNKTGLSYIHPSLFAALHLLLELALPCCLDHELGLSLCHRPHFLSRQDLFACEKRRGHNYVIRTAGANRKTNFKKQKRSKKPTF